MPKNIKILQETVQNAPPRGAKDSEDLARRIEELERELSGLSGTTGTALSSALPRTRNSAWSAFTIDGQPIEKNLQPETMWLSVNADYFTTMDIAVRQGRRFSTADRHDAAPVIVINQRMVDLHFPEGGALGGLARRVGRVIVHPATIAHLYAFAYIWFAGEDLQGLIRECPITGKLAAGRV